MVTLKILFTPFPEECCGYVQGICRKLSENEYGIGIDSTLPEEIQKAVLWHEKAHIYLGHLESCLPIREIEAEADEIAFIETGVLPHEFER